MLQLFYSLMVAFAVPLHVWKQPAFRSPGCGSNSSKEKLPSCNCRRGYLPKGVLGLSGILWVYGTPVWTYSNFCCLCSNIPVAHPRPVYTAVGPFNILMYSSLLILHYACIGEECTLVFFAVCLHEGRDSCSTVCSCCIWSKTFQEPEELDIGTI